MKPLDTLVIDHTVHDKHIEIIEGDLTEMAAGEDVDVLVVSAFPDDYRPTPSSVIGTLHRKGVSVAALAERKAYDLRRDFSCWLSEEVQTSDPGLRFKRVLCFEPAYRSGPVGNRVDDIFRALAPFIGEKPHVTSVAMPLVACGDQMTPVEQIVESLVGAAAYWMRTSPLHRVRIVERDPSRAHRLKEAFKHVKARIIAEQNREPKKFDVFLSYSHKNDATADLVENTLLELRPSARIFRDKKELQTGGDYRVQLDEAIRSTRRFLPLLTPEYVESTSCQDEFNAAWSLRDRVSPDLFFPLLISPVASGDRRMSHLHYEDCAKYDHAKIRQACAKLIQHFPPA